MGSQGKFRSSLGDGDGRPIYMERSSSLALDSDSVLAEESGTSEPVLLRGEFSEGAPESPQETHKAFLRGKVRLFGHFVPVQSLLLAGVEGTLFVLLGLLSLNLAPRLFHTVGSAQPLQATLIQSATIGVVLLLALVAVGLYSAHQRAELGGVISRTLVGFAGAALVLQAVYWLAPGVAVAPPVLGITLLFCLAAFAMVRPVFYHYVDASLLTRRVLVVGTGERARSIEGLRRKSDQRGFRLVGFVNVSSQGKILVREDKVIHLQSQLCRYALEHDVDEIVIAVDDRRQGAVPTDELLNCRMSGMDVTDILDFFERESGKIRLDLLRPGWLIHSDGFKHNLVRDFAKRAFDLALGTLLFAIASPLMVLTALAIYIESGGKGTVLFRQKRVGKGGKEFELIKFRSMCMDAEKDGKPRWATPDDPRVTRVGRFIRLTRLDELPQLWNVLRNDMSIVGPRPERPEFVRRLVRREPLYRERHRVKPGITGWAQVRYPYGDSEEKSIRKLEYDLYYVKNHRLVFDLYILIQTVEVVFFKKGAH